MIVFDLLAWLGAAGGLRLTYAVVGWPAFVVWASAVLFAQWVVQPK